MLVLAGTTVQLCVSGDVYAEYEEVIQRPKFNRSEMIIDHALRAIRQNGFWVKPSERVHACSDPDDDIFLECAQAAHANYLVTGNLKDFPVKWADTQIVTARQFLGPRCDSFTFLPLLASTRTPLSAGAGDYGV